ncbi:autotransporter domain-containing protein [Bradyrhizobium sp. Leo170]|nr:autotransporter domain-containing protein [Bradyrhizobium sp. Leo170]
MRCSWRPSGASSVRGCRGLAWAIAGALCLAIGTICSAQAQSRPPTPAPTPTPPPAASPTPSPSPTPIPSPTAGMVNADLAAGSAIANLGSNFLERIGNQATNGFNRMARTNPGGGGASESVEAPRFRTWFEGYGISARNDAVGDFVGDRRKTWGGVAGIGARIAPGVNLGFSVDQSRTDIDVPLALQSAAIDLTQLGAHATVDKGPWTWAMAVVHGFGNIHSSRDTGLGLATAGYNAKLDGALSEFSYYWDKDQSRIVPKASLEYVRARTGSFQEFGGLDPVFASAATVERMRVMIGAEVGHYWIFDQKVFDLSAYGKFVDNVAQNFGDITVSLGSQSITLQGIAESQYGADAGAVASLNLTNTARLYLNYDGKFRAAMQSHQGAVGVEFKW